MERDRLHLSTITPLLNFNSHAHVERDDKTTLKGVAGKDFNSHAHVERDYPYNFNAQQYFTFQLTRSRGA